MTALLIDFLMIGVGMGFDSWNYDKLSEQLANQFNEASAALSNQHAVLSGYMNEQYADLAGMLNERGQMLVDKLDEVAKLNQRSANATISSATINAAQGIMGLVGEARDYYQQLEKDANSIVDRIAGHVSSFNKTVSEIKDAYDYAGHPFGGKK